MISVSGSEAAKFTVEPDVQAAQTASAAGFHPVWRLHLPDGTWATVYWRAVGAEAPSSCSTT